MSIALIDFGSQYSHLLKRSLENIGYFVKLMTFNEYCYDRANFEGIILSGGPKSLKDDNIAYRRTKLYDDMCNMKPILGICYGFQILANLHNCEVRQGIHGEYGRTIIHSNYNDCEFVAWMSHRDIIIPNDSIDIGYITENRIPASFLSKNYNVSAFQFHPEVKHTDGGEMLLKTALGIINFPKPNSFKITRATDIPDDMDKALCAFSGGVDSLVAAVHTHKQIGNRLHCLYIDTGMMRNQDIFHIEKIRELTGLDIEVLDAKRKFLDELKDISEPEAKRKVIGRVFIEVFEDYIRRNAHNYTHLVQGTIYPDVIESSNTNGQAEVIKSHHNVGGLPEDMNLKLYEPLREFYKDDVRMFGLNLELSHDLVYRHPFPGPGLGIRILGEIDEESLRIAKESDQILFDVLKETKTYSDTWQAFTVVLPCKTVGVKGDSRTYEKVVAVRCVCSEDGMTATFSRLPYDVLEIVSTRIMNEVKGINRVVYDISNKPCATIEWE